MSRGMALGALCVHLGIFAVFVGVGMVIGHPGIGVIAAGCGSISGGLTRIGQSKRAHQYVIRGEA